VILQSADMVSLKEHHQNKIMMDFIFLGSFLMFLTARQRKNIGYQSCCDVKLCVVFEKGRNVSKAAIDTFISHEYL